MTELNKKQELFCREYIIDFNATRAYAKVYNRKHDETCRVNGHELLTNTNVQKYITKLLKPKCDKLNITIESVLKDILEIKERCMQSKPVMEYDKSSKEWIETGEWEFDASGALKATEQLGRYLKMFTDKKESININKNTNEFTEGQIEKLAKAIYDRKRNPGSK